jgi:hypothetical protein
MNGRYRRSPGVCDRKDTDVKTLFRGGSVIVADNDPMIRGILRSKPEAAGLTVFVASRGLAPG